MPTIPALTCVIVDDHPSMVDIIKYHCKTAGIRVQLSTSDPIKAYEYVQSNHTAIDILFTDLEMPVLKGEKLVKQLSKVIPIDQLIIIIISGFAEALPELPGKKTYFIRKPITKKKWKDCLAAITRFKD